MDSACESIVFALPTKVLGQKLHGYVREHLSKFEQALFAGLPHTVIADAVRAAGFTGTSVHTVEQAVYRAGKYGRAKSTVNRDPRPRFGPPTGPTGDLTAKLSRATFKSIGDERVDKPWGRQLNQWFTRNSRSLSRGLSKICPKRRRGNSEFSRSHSALAALRRSFVTPYSPARSAALLAERRAEGAQDPKQPSRPRRARYRPRFRGYCARS